MANATGAGGGVVFVPAFNMLNVGAESIIATSFAIQCFGMTAGTLAWRRYANMQSYTAQAQADPEMQAIWAKYWQYVLLFSIPSIVGVLMGQTLFAIESPETVKNVFKSFSVLFGITILITTAYIVWYQKLHQPPMRLAGFPLLAILIAWLGGLITAWLSIGIGELVAVLLILMRFPVRFAIGVAVSVSAISVWFGVQRYLWWYTDIDFNVLIFAAPAAVIGGTLAKRVVAYFSPVQVKVFIALWILISAIAM